MKKKPKIEKFLRKTYPESHRVFHFDKQLAEHKDIVEVAGYFKENGEFHQVSLWEDYRDKLEGRVKEEKEPEVE